MPVKKKTKDTSETTAIKAPRKRASKKAIEAETLTDNDSMTTNEVIEAIGIKEVGEVTNNKSVEVANIPASANVETTPLANLDTIETAADNNQTSATDSANEDLKGSEKKKKKKGKHSDGRMGKQDIDVQKEFYDRIINEKLEVTIHVQLGKLKIEGVITYEDQYSILIKSKFGEQMLYKQGISFISFKKPFRKPFIKRDRPFFNNRENIDNQTSQQAHNQNSEQAREFQPRNNYRNDRNDRNQTDFRVRGKEFYQSETAKADTDNKSRVSSNEGVVTKHQTSLPTTSQSKVQTNTQNQNLGQKQTTQPSLVRPNATPKIASKEQNQPSKNQAQKDPREVKVYKIVCAPPVKPKK